MKKNLLLVFILISTFGFSQQALKKITETADYTIVEIYSLRNGTTNLNISGVQNFTGSDNNHFISFRDTDLNQGVTSNNGNLLSGTVSHIENICSTNLSLNPYCSFGICARENWDYTYGNANPVPYQYQLKNTKEYFENGDTNNDGLIDCFKFTAYIPKKLSNGNFIPTTNLWCWISGYKPYYNGGQQLIDTEIVLRFNGTTWVLQTTYSNGSPVTALQDVCGSLSVSEIDISKNQLVIYPNPTNNFITIQNKQNTTENYDYKIVDLTGRIIKKGNTKFNEQINIESLESGNYIVQIQTENGEKLMEKLVKK